VPLIAYVHARDEDPPAGGRQPWEPNWRMWRWIAGAVVAVYGATRSDGAVELLFVLTAFVLVCLAAEAALPRGDGLREWRQ
jgi:hypothetical protein